MANSYECYKELAMKVKYQGYRVTKGDILGMFEQMSQELIVNSNAALLDSAVKRWISYCNQTGKRTISYLPKYFLVSARNYGYVFSTYDAWYWITFLADYMEDKVEEKLLEAWIPYMFGDYYSQEQTSRALEQALQRIDQSLVKKRQMLLQKQTEEPKKEPQRAVRETFEKDKEILDGFGETRKLLQEVNDRMRQTEELLEEKNTKKAYGQLLELYNLMGDVIDSQYAQEKVLRNPQLDDMMENLRVFQDMIVEYLGEYGIRTIASPRGSAFDGKIHEVRNTSNFYPKTAMVDRSLRNGFIWGSQVLQKEKITLKTQEENVCI